MANSKKKPELKLVFSSANLMEANEVKSVLEGSGVTVFLMDGHVIGLNPLYSGPLGGIKLCVPEPELDRVRDVFKDVLKYDGELPMAGKSFHPFIDAPRAAKTSKESLTCASCKAPLDPDSDFCDQCGDKVQPDSD